MAKTPMDCINENDSGLTKVRLAATSVPSVVSVPKLCAATVTRLPTGALMEARDWPSFNAAVDAFTGDFARTVDDLDKLMTNGPIFRKRTEGIGILANIETKRCVATDKHVYAFALVLGVEVGELFRP